MPAAMQPKFPIRRAGPADAAAIDALTQAAYAKWVPIIGRKPLPMRADYACAVREHRIEVIDLDGRLAALAELAIEPDHLLIVNLAVAPDRQGRGLGSALLHHADDVAAELGLAEVRLYTNSLMAANIALYRRYGYAVDRMEPRSPQWSVVFMSKRRGA
jgi:ribosomal protein S18 acetylase RimI-like enzyme